MATVPGQGALAKLAQAESQTELVRVVAANTEALRSVSAELRWCKERNWAAGGSRE